MSLKLIYFKMRALAEAPLMLMHCHDLEHEYLMSWEHFEDVWANVKPKIAFRQLPMLEVDNSTQICQSIAILQFLESRAGLAIEDPIQAAKSSAILQSTQELFFPLNPAVNFAVGDSFISKRDEMREMLIARFADLSRCLSENDARYFCDDIPRAAEFATFHHLDLSKLLDPTLISEFPRLEMFLTDMQAIPQMKDYLLARPELIDVGIAPKLVINGIAHPTGTQQT